MTTLFFTACPLARQSRAYGTSDLFGDGPDAFFVRRRTYSLIISRGFGTLTISGNGFAVVADLYFRKTLERTPSKNLRIYQERLFVYGDPTPRDLFRIKRPMTRYRLTVISRTGDLAQIAAIKPIADPFPQVLRRHHLGFDGPIGDTPPCVQTISPIESSRRARALTLPAGSATVPLGAVNV